MRSAILNTATTYLLPLLLVFSVFLLLRGHNEPGGGFAGGLVAAAGFALLATGAGVEAARRALHVDPRTLIAAGLLVALLSTLPGMAIDGIFLAAAWWTIDLPGGGSFYVGTPLLFDLGVYLAVIGTVLAIVFALEEEEPA
ncbi:MAG: Na+/H+ antiporter subunit B [Chloroflexi bacterium]|jgi:multicomponent Na+:H+ antiporter subunit B|nr:Na+/H+ antiporter subunit B [Chloroflexota bacterium]